MARLHGGSFLVNEEGQPIENADVSIYLSGSTTPVTIYEDELAPTKIDSAPQLKTLKNGYFEFGLPDPASSIGYNTNQKFKIEGDKEGVEYGYIDYIDIYPPLVPVDETSDETTRNKVISNRLANLGELHRVNDSHVVHGIEEVNEDDNINTIKNKLISNSLAYKGDGHVDSLVNDTSTMTASADYPHNIKQLDLTIDVPNDQYEYNRVISGYQGNEWNEHYLKSFDDEPHNIELVDETDSDTEKNKLVSNDLIRQFYYERGKIQRHDVLIPDWYLNSDNDYEININHDMNEQYPLIQTWDIDTNQMVHLQEIRVIDKGNLKLINNIQLNLKVVISS